MREKSGSARTFGGTPVQSEREEDLGNEVWGKGGIFAAVQIYADVFLVKLSCETKFRPGNESPWMMKKLRNYRYEQEYAAQSAK